MTARPSSIAVWPRSTAPSRRWTARSRRRRAGGSSGSCASRRRKGCEPMGLLDRFRRQAGGSPASSGLTRLPGSHGPSGLRARLEGAMSRRRLRGWNPPLENVNALVASGGPKLLARARELVVTNGYAANACEAFAANLVGDGIKPSSLIDDAGVRDRVQRLWLAWTDEADADGLTDFYGLQAMVAREMFVAGECFVRLRPRRAEDGLLVPLQMQLLQSEMLPFEKTETAEGGMPRSSTRASSFADRASPHHP